MEKILKCPYCGKEMHRGVIYQDRYALKWIPEENDKGVVLQWLSKGIKLTNSLEKGGVESLYCEYCEKIIIDTKDRTDKYE